MRDIPPKINWQNNFKKWIDKTIKKMRDILPKINWHNNLKKWIDKTILKNVLRRIDITIKKNELTKQF